VVGGGGVPTESQLGQARQFWHGRKPIGLGGHPPVFGSFGIWRPVRRFLEALLWALPRREAGLEGRSVCGSASMQGLCPLPGPSSMAARFWFTKDLGRFGPIAGPAAPVSAPGVAISRGAWLDGSKGGSFSRLAGVSMTPCAVSLCATAMAIFLLDLALLISCRRGWPSGTSVEATAGDR